MNVNFHQYLQSFWAGCMWIASFPTSNLRFKLFDENPSKFWDIKCPTNKLKQIVSTYMIFEMCHIFIYPRKSFKINLQINLFQFWTCISGIFLFVLYHLEPGKFMRQDIFQLKIFCSRVFSPYPFLKTVSPPVGLLKVQFISIPLITG
jgi:hypothetical protein